MSYNEEYVNNFNDFNLNSNICKAIELCGYTTPTPVQAKAIPEILAGRDVVVSAQTGTGKTAAFVLPAMHDLGEQAVLILTPTRELASQITKAADTYGKFMRFNIVSLVGGMPYHNQIRDLARGADIIVATPGRLMDHIEQKRVDLSNIKMLILDEADRMLDMGFIEDVQYIAKLTPTKRQTLLFSATLDNKLMNAVKHLLKNPVRIDLSEALIASPQIRQEMYKTSNLHHKTRLLKHFLRDENIYKAIIFSATKINADRLAEQLQDDGFAAAALHGDLRQNVRNRTLEQLRKGKIQFLVATDVAARGIDISDITHVFNFDLPRFCEDYVHRIGRTGRAGKTGVAISFVLPTDMHHLKSIERYTKQRIQLIHDVEIGGVPHAAHTAKKMHDSGEILSLKKGAKKDYSENDFSFDDERPRKKHSGGREFDRGFSKKEYGKSERSSGRSSGRGFGKSSERGSERRSERSFGKNSERGFGKSSERSSERNFGDKPRGGRFNEKSSGRFENKADRDFDRDVNAFLEKTENDRKFKSGQDDRTEGGEGRNFRADRGDRSEGRGERSFKSGRGDRTEGRGERSFRSSHGESTGRSERSFRSGRGESTEGRGERSFRSGRNEGTAGRGERSFRSGPSDRTAGRGERSFSSERSERTEKPSFREQGYRPKSKLSFDKSEGRGNGEKRGKKSFDKDSSRRKNTD
jgi:superfamily II DNA/RNA helicase